MFFIEQYSYTNKLRSIHPMEKFCMASVTLMISLFFNSWLLHLFVITFMTFLILYATHIPIKAYVRLMIIPLIFLTMGLLGIALSITKDTNVIVIYGFSAGKWLIGFTKEGISQALIIFFRAYAGVTCLYFLTLTTPMVDVIWVLKKLKVPVIITELMTIVYRFIFVLLETAFTIYISQECRLGYSSLKRSYNSIGQLIANLFLNSFHRARELFIALSARGYTGELIVLEEDYQLSRRNITIIILTEIMFLAIASVS